MSESSTGEKPYKHVRNYPQARTYYLLYPTGNRLATVMFMKDTLGKWCRGVSIMSAQKGSDNRYDVNTGRQKAWRRLQAAIHRRITSLPINLSYESTVAFMEATQGGIREKSGYDVELTAKEKAIADASEKKA